MKQVFIKVLKSYRVLKPALHLIQVSVFGFSSTCRYRESCSRYTIRQIQKHGTITGFKKGLRRVLSCYGYAID